MPGELKLDVYSTAPQSADHTHETFVEACVRVSQWSEEAGCEGMLIYTDNRLIDPWLVAQIVLQNTERLCPLVATQPIYMHPYTVANMVTSFAYLYRRRIALNMLAGGFRNDLLALGDPTPHDERYQRMTEYTQIIQALLRADGPVSFSGRFYEVHNLILKPPMPPDLFPVILQSGSSEAGRRSAEQLGSIAVEYPKPGHEYDPADSARRAERRAGIRIGIIADDDADTAWRIAHERFPEDRRGQITHAVAMKVSDSEWHRQLSEMTDKAREARVPYWLHPFENYKTFCPYLVGDFDEVSDEVAHYVRAGFRTFILDIPAERRDLEMAGRVFRMAADKARA